MSTSTGSDRSTPPPGAARRRLGLPRDGPLVVSVSRLVPRKGMDVLIDAAAALVPSFPDLTVVIAGVGRDRARLDGRVTSQRAGADGRVGPRRRLPLSYGVADVFVMACRDRWLGLEQEGFGIVFLEAAACGVAQVAGRAAVPTRPSSTARRGSWSTTRVTPDGWPGPCAACSPTTSSDAAWDGPPGAGPGRASLGPSRT